MNDKDFLIKYEDLLNKGYCDCNEMNCIDNNSPRRILNIAIKQQKEIERLKNIINELEKWLDKKEKLTFNSWNKGIHEVQRKLQELKDSDNNVKKINTNNN